MRLLYVADGRSPIALNWISHFIKQGYEVHLVSMFPCQPLLNLASITHIPVPFSQWGDAAGGETSAPSWRGRFIARLATVRVRTALRHWLIPPALPAAASRLQTVIRKVKPDLVHAMRIPYEGMLAGIALTGESIPFIISIWGNDFTLHAASTPLMQQGTRNALQRVDGLHTDCRRDLGLAGQWGFAPHKPSVVLPGGGGIRPEIFYPPGNEGTERSQPVLIQPRGLRAYVRNDTIFEAFTAILNELPDVHLLCPAMAGSQVGEALLKRYGSQAVDVLPRLTQAELAGLYRKSQIALSITEHDGTPNTLLEAMACGCFPIVSDLESLREWIVDGVNGLLVPPGNPHTLAQAVLRVLRDPQIRRRAQDQNYRRIAEQADYIKVMQSAEKFYRSLLRRE